MSPINLPLFPNKNLGSIKSSFNTGHAQNFSVSRLNTSKDIDNAKVSVAEVGNRPKPTTSVNRVGGLATSVSTSVAHVGVNSNPENYNQNEADDKRYDYIRRLAMDKKKEREENEAQSNVYDLGIKTGGSFRTRGINSIKRKLNRLYSSAPTTFKNIDKEDRKYIADKIGEHANKVRVGVGFGRQVKKKMKREIKKDRQKGIINKVDSQDMKKIVDNLQH